MDVADRLPGVGDGLVERQLDVDAFADETLAVLARQAVQKAICDTCIRVVQGDS
jgi:hypothetical protein